MTQSTARGVRCPSYLRGLLLHGIATLILPVVIALLSIGPYSIVHGADSAGVPNVIFILADDLGWADLGCQGNTYHQTPNLDRLAASGTRFTDAYAASSVCSPTRASILSGKYPARLDLTIWLGGSSGTRHQLLDAPYARQLPLEEVTLAETLREAGYETAAIGKWHLGGEPYYPEHQGFDLNVGGTHSGSPAGGYFLPNKMVLKDMKRGEYLTDRLTDEAVKFISAKRDRPFFLYQSYHSVHVPIQGKEALVEFYRQRMKPGQKNKNPAYAAMVHSLDENVGRILDTLDRLKLAEKTIVVFFSDNGGFLGATTNAPLRLGKGYSYEGGHREPLLVRAPGVTTPGSTCGEPVISTDFYPTLLELAGVPLRPAQHVDGVSFARVLGDSEAKLPERPLFWHFPHYSPQGGTPSGAVRLGDYKLIEFFENGRLELYNLKEDVGEENDLADLMPEKVDELLKLLTTWRKDVDAKMPPANPNFQRQ